MNIFTNCFLMLVFPSNWFSHCKNYFSVIRRNGGNRSCAIIFILHSPLLVERTFVWTIFSVPYPDVVSAFACNDMKKLQHKNWINVNNSYYFSKVKSVRYHNNHYQHWLLFFIIYYYRNSRMSLWCAFI